MLCVCVSKFYHIKKTRSQKNTPKEKKLSSESDLRETKKKKRLAMMEGEIKEMEYLQLFVSEVIAQLNLPGVTRTIHDSETASIGLKHNRSKRADIFMIRLNRMKSPSQFASLTIKYGEEYRSLFFFR